MSEVGSRRKVVSEQKGCAYHGSTPITEKVQGGSQVCIMLPGAG